MDWLGWSKMSLTHSTSPRVLLKRNGDTTDIVRICEDTIPPCHLNPLLFNRHLQTIWAAVRPDAPVVYYRRRVFQCHHKVFPGTFTVDFVVDPFEKSESQPNLYTTYFSEEEFERIRSSDNDPMLVVLHGLAGGSQETYLRHTVKSMYEQGWNICVVNARGCAGSKVTTSYLYNGRATWDVRQVRFNTDL